jgi:diguanylate cyclase (GGDEF)-like protein
VTSELLKKSQEIDVSDPPEQGYFERLLEKITGFFQSLNVLTLVTYCVAVLAFALLTDKLYESVPTLLGQYYQTVANRLADEATISPSSTQIMKTLCRYNLAWYYVVDGVGAIEPITKPYAPLFNDLGNRKSRFVNWKGDQYFDAVAQTDRDHYLHIGFAAAPALPFITNQNAAFVLPVRAGYLVITWIGTLLVLLFVFKDTVSKPLRRIAQASTCLLLSRDAYSGVTQGGLNMSFFVVSEVKRIARELKEVRRQYDAQYFARAQKEQELHQQRASHEITQDKLHKEFAKKLGESERSLSELHAKESEEEFIHGLSHSIATLRSKHQVFRTILDRLNDKYPSSIVHAAFFTIDSGQISVDTFIGFDDRALKALKAVHHGELAQELFSLGSHMHLGLDGFRDRGLQEVAQQLALKSAAYFPLSFQGRNMSFLAVYFAIEGQSVLDRIRVLRKVVEVTSRHLYQIDVYVEELEAARTDPLTGLRNRKYFYEIVPQIFERASIDPENSPFSFLMVDGDNFKQINDTFGHQTGDDVLKELAATLKRCVRITTDGTRPKDCLVRFGGEEFLIILEKTALGNAEIVAERIRNTVAQKEHWPGGLAHWTVSIGISTYPMDGTSVDQLLLQADKALYYVKKELSRNNISHASKVPKSFKWAKTYAKLAGELGVFEPATLLQAFANAHKSGVLTVNSSKEQYFWLLFSGGIALQARAGNLKGADAVTELLTTFEDGGFKFQEQGPGQLRTLPKLDETFNILEALPKCLLDGAMAKDKFDLAQSIISSDSAVLTLVPHEEFNARWNVLKQLPDPPTEDEIKLMLELSERIDGVTPLSVILKAMDASPTALLWNAAACLVQHGLVRQRKMP